MKPSKTPLIVYIHVPKTGGSTVNKALTDWAEGCDHVEKFVDQPALFLRNCSRYRWISGHIPIYKMQRLLAPLRRELRYFATVRDPLSQVRSHFNWLFEIHRISEDFYLKHPEPVRRISDELRSRSFESPKDILDCLLNYHWLFLNCQSRFFFPNVFDWTHPRIDQVLAGFEFVASDETVPTMLRKMDKDIRIPDRQNVSSYHFDKCHFEADVLRQVLRSQNSFDRQLYAAVRHRFGRSERSS